MKFDLDWEVPIVSSHQEIRSSDSSTRRISREPRLGNDRDLTGDGIEGCCLGIESIRVSDDDEFVAKGRRHRRNDLGLMIFSSIDSALGRVGVFWANKVIEVVVKRVLEANFATLRRVRVEQGRGGNLSGHRALMLGNA